MLELRSGLYCRSNPNVLPQVRNMLFHILSIYLFKCLFNEVVKPLHDVAPHKHTNSHLATSLQQYVFKPLGFPMMIKQP